MDETEPTDGAYPSVAEFLNIAWTWVKNNKALFFLMLLVVLTALIPLYVVSVPSNVDLPEHILISKLLWEKLSGVSKLDLEVSLFLAYRLIPALFVAIMAFCKFWGISFLMLPKIIVTLLVSIHSLVVITIFYLGLKERTWQSRSFAFCFALPAIVCLYSACWFIGFVNFTIAITLLVPAVFLTERFIRSGKVLDAFLLFFTLLIVYTAHPFAPTFWLMWCFSRSVASIVTRSFFLEWKKLVMLGVVFLPIFLYHVLATAGTEFAPASGSFLSNFPFVSVSEWYQNRLGAVLSGSLIKADDAADSRIFAIVALGLITFSTILAFRFSQNQWTRKLAVSSVMLLFLASWINEKFFPIPPPHWLAYDYRFISAIYAVCLAVAGMILIRFLPVAGSRLPHRATFAVLAVLSVLASIDHLVEVRKANARFDAPAREYMAKVFNGETPAGISLPHSRWHPDGTLIRLYICLVQPDCNPKGTTFESFGGSLYAVRLRSRNLLPAAEPPLSKQPPAAPVNAFDGGEGNGRGQFSKPHGIAADDNGNFYVADTGNNRIQKFDSSGNFILAFGTAGTGEGEFKSPNGIAVDAVGSIYVVDSSNGKLIRFDSDGKFEKEWRGPDPGFYGPRDIAIGPNKQLYIVDQGATRIVKFDPATEAFSSWGTGGNGEGQFHESTGITVGGGFVFVADLGNDRIQVFDLDGKFVRQWEVPVWERYPWHYPDAAFDEQTNHLYVTNGWKKEVLAFDIDGNSVANDLSPDTTDMLDNPSSIILSRFNKERRLYVLNTGSSKVALFTLGTR